MPARLAPRAVSLLGGFDEQSRQNVPRVDGAAKMRGWAQYRRTSKCRGWCTRRCCAVPIRMPACARRRAARRRSCPGVVAVLTRDDLKGMNAYFGPVVKDQPVVAIDRVRYVGEVIAAVAAEGRDIAEEALDLIEVEYEPLPAVFDPAEAMKPEAPVLHTESAKSETRLDKASFDFKSNSNVLSIYHVEEGDVGVGFKESDEIFEDVYTSPKIQHGHIEPHAALAYWEPSGKLVIYTVHAESVIDTGSAGGAFRSAAIQGASHRAVCRRRLWGEGASAAGAYWRRIGAQGTSAGAVGVDAGRSVFDGPLSCFGGEDQDRSEKRWNDRRATCRSVYDTGAYALTGPSDIKNGGEVAGGPYRIGHQHLTSYCVYTNTPPTGPYRGFGVPQVCWAYESQMDDIARRLGIDPLELRLKNMVHEGDVFVTGDKLVSVGLSDCVKRAAEALGWKGAGGTGFSGTFWEGER